MPNCLRTRPLSSGSAPSSAPASAASHVLAQLGKSQRLRHVVEGYAVLHSDADGQCGGGPHLDAARVQGPDLFGRQRLRQRQRRDRHRLQLHRIRRRGRDDHGRQRGDRLAAGDRRICVDARDVDAQRRPHAREPAVRPGARRIRARRGRGRPRARGVRERQSPRRADVLRDSRLRAVGRRVRLGRRRSRTERRYARAAPAPSPRPASSPQTSTTSTRTGRRRRSAIRPSRRRSKRPSASSAHRHRRQLDQVDARSRARRRRRHRRRGDGAGGARRHHAADDQLRVSRSGMYARLRSQRGAPARRSASRSRTRSVSAATTASSSSAKSERNASGGEARRRRLRALLRLAGVRDATIWRPSRRAFVHESHAKERGGASNERMEFLGDSVLGFIAAELALRAIRRRAGRHAARCARRPSSTTPRSRDTARRLGFREVVALGVGMRASGGADNTSILADAFEAFVAALYLTYGVEKARRFVRGRASSNSSIRPADELLDPKTRLQHYAQEHLAATPVYHETKPRHAAAAGVQLARDRQRQDLGNRSSGPRRKPHNRPPPKRRWFRCGLDVG